MPCGQPVLTRHFFHPALFLHSPEGGQSKYPEKCAEKSISVKSTKPRQPITSDDYPTRLFSPKAQFDVPKTHDISDRGFDDRGFADGRKRPGCDGSKRPNVAIALPRRPASATSPQPAQWWQGRSPFEPQLAAREPRPSLVFNQPAFPGPSRVDG